MILQLFGDYWNLLEVYAKALYGVAPLQDEDVGDGTTSLIILTAEMFKNTDEFVKKFLKLQSLLVTVCFARKSVNISRNI